MVGDERSPHSSAYHLGRSADAGRALSELHIRFWRASALVAALFFGRSILGTASAQTPLRWVLVYAGGPHRPAYSVEDFTDLLAAVDTNGHPVGWLCRGTVFLEFHAVSGRFYMPQVNGSPSTGQDWSAYLDSLFATGGPLTRLDSAAAFVSHSARTPAQRVAVAIMVPFPDPSADTLRFGGRLYHFGTDSERVAAVSAYMTETKRRFAAARLGREDLTAFYWLNEGVTVADTAVMRRVADAAHELSARLLWIPYYTAPNALRWKALGFDEAWLQPNYFFHPDVAAVRLDSAVARARAAEMGLELEFDPRMFAPGQFADRLEPYLAALEGSPDLRAKSIAIYEGAGALIQLARSRDSWHRALYARLVAALQPPTPPAAGR